MDISLFIIFMFYMQYKIKVNKWFFKNCHFRIYLRSNPLDPWWSFYFSYFPDFLEHLTSICFQVFYLESGLKFTLALGGGENAKKNLSNPPPLLPTYKRGLLSVLWFPLIFFKEKFQNSIQNFKFKITPPPCPKMIFTWGSQPPFLVQWV